MGWLLQSQAIERRLISRGVHSDKRNVRYGTPSEQYANSMPKLNGCSPQKKSTKSRKTKIKTNESRVPVGVGVFAHGPSARPEFDIGLGRHLGILVHNEINVPDVASLEQCVSE